MQIPSGIVRLLCNCLLVAIAALAGGQGVHAEKEFLLTGTVDCGRRSGQHCDVGTTVAVWTTDVSGVRQRVLVDLSWVTSQLGRYDQDDLICLEVRAQGDGTLRAVGVSNACAAPTPRPRPKKDDSPHETPPVAGINPPRADLRVTKVGSEDFCPSEAPCPRWVIEVTNLGPDTATGVSVAELPNGVTVLTSPNPTPSASKGAYNAATGIWTIGTLTLNETVQLELSTNTDRFDAAENCAQVNTSDQNDPQTGNNSDCDTVQFTF